MYLCWGIARTRPSIEQVGQPRGWCLHRRDPDQGRPQLRKKNKWTIPATIELNYDIPERSDAVKEVRNCLEYSRRALARRRPRWRPAYAGAMHAMSKAGTAT